MAVGWGTQHLDAWPALKVSYRRSQHFRGEAQEDAYCSPGVPGGVMMGVLRPWERGLACAVGHRSAWTRPGAPGLCPALQVWGKCRGSASLAHCPHALGASG